MPLESMKLVLNEDLSAVRTEKKKNTHAISRANAL